MVLQLSVSVASNACFGIGPPVNSGFETSRLLGFFLVLYASLQHRLLRGIRVSYCNSHVHGLVV